MVITDASDTSSYVMFSNTLATDTVSLMSSILHIYLGSYRYSATYSMINTINEHG